MPELDIRVARWFRSQSDPVVLWLTNRTDKLLAGTISFRNNTNVLRPLVAGSSARVELPAQTLLPQNNVVTVSLYAPRDPSFKLREDLTLDTYTFGSFAIALGDKGVSYTRGVKFFWREGSPALRPTLFVKDGRGTLHRLSWGPIADNQQGEMRECLVEGGVKSLQVTGKCTINGSDHPIGDGEDGLSIPVEDPDAGIYFLTRSLKA